MTYFELFGLPIGFKVDTVKLRQAFMDIQRMSHPDKFAQASPEEQEVALEKSALANKGFSVLNHPEKVLPYVLETLGLLEPEEKYALQPAFLMEMMDLNEAWMDADTEDEKQKVIHQVKQIQNDIYEPLKATLETADINDIPAEKLLQIKEYYYKKKYLDRILADFRY
jgi:molecular chaperone HscB